MKKHVDNSEEKWFVRGCEIHRLQDAQTSNTLKEIFENTEKSTYKEYIIHCALLDCYFLKKTNKYIYSDYVQMFNFYHIKETLNKLNMGLINSLNYINLDNNSALDKLNFFMIQ